LTEYFYFSNVNSSTDKRLEFSSSQLSPNPGGFIAAGGVTGRLHPAQNIYGMAG